MPARNLVDEEVSVPEAIARVLEEAGVDFVFGMPGGRTIPIYGALYDHREKVRCVLVREEGLAAVMAAIGTAWILVIMAEICADIIGRAGFNRPILGVPEFLQFSIVGIVFLQLPQTLRIGGLTRRLGVRALRRGVEAQPHAEYEQHRAECSSGGLHRVRSS